MDILVTGIKKYELEKMVVPVIEKFRFLDSNYEFEFNQSNAQKIIDSSKKIDLIILGGSVLTSGSPFRDYKLAVEFAKKNKQIPSIMLVYPVYRAVIDCYNQTHPPNATRSFTEFSRMGEVNFRAVLEGKNVPWRLG